jgi:glycogen synthase
MKVLMFGWEFPPFNSGGLGTACYGLVKSLAKKSSVTLVLPFPCESEFAKTVDINRGKMDKARIKKVDFFLIPYMTSSEYEVEVVRRKKEGKPYASSLVHEVKRYASLAPSIAEEEDFDVIHAHDWLTYEAGINAKEVSGKPLVVHMHATEFDRCGGPNVNTQVYEIEKRGMEYADLVIAVSNLTKETIVKYYGINSDKIMVVHNSIEHFPSDPMDFPLKEGNKIVLFLGRITIQKGPEYFIYMAKRIAEFYPDVKFVVAGDGDMKKFMIDETARLGLMDKFIFTGFLRGKDIEKAYKMADVYVMPSVSEPFGLTALESVSNGTPVVISKTSGVAEVLKNSFKVDFWDTEEMASKIVALLRYPELKQCLADNSKEEIRRFSWDEAADKCVSLYQSVLA